MSSETLSDQSCVRDGVGYNDVYPLGLDDPNTSYDERVLSSNSSFVEGDEDVNVDGSEGDLNEDLVSAEPSPQSVIGPDGLRQFIFLPLWTVNDFKSTIKQKHFDTLKEKYQILVNIPICLPYKSEKCYNRGVDEVGM